MTTIMASFKGNWAEKIIRQIGLTHKLQPIYLKTIEMRKSTPKDGAPFKVFMYVSKGNFDITDCPDLSAPSVQIVGAGRGKVIGEFICEDVDEYAVFNDTLYCVKNTQANKLSQLCLNIEQVKRYLGAKNKGYGWHISNLVIYDKPRELRDFAKPCPTDKGCYLCGKSGYRPDMILDCFNTFTRPPQSWQRVNEVPL